MALSAFYITFEFSDNINFPAPVSQSLSMLTMGATRVDEADIGTGGGGSLDKSALYRGEYLAEFYPFSTTAATAYPDGQDEEDLETLKDKFQTYNYARISASNLQCFAEFPTRHPLPRMVVASGDWSSSKDVKGQVRKVTMLFQTTERV